MPHKASVAIVGSGNISTDLLYKLLRSEWLEPRWMVGIDPDSEGLARARKLGLETSADGADWLLGLDEKPDLLFETTSKGVEIIGGAKRGKAIIILNPADPPMIMRDTIFCAIPEDADRDAIAQSIHDVVAEVQTYVPGYRLLNEPQFDEPSMNSGGQALVTTFIEVEGAGDYLPPYSGNLDIMTAAATKVGEEIAKESLTATAG